MLTSILDFQKCQTPEQVKKDGGSWGNVSSKDCGNIVSKAIEIANRAVE